MIRVIALENAVSRATFVVSTEGSGVSWWRIQGPTVTTLVDLLKPAFLWRGTRLRAYAHAYGYAHRSGWLSAEEAVSGTRDDVPFELRLGEGVRTVLVRAHASSTDDLQLVVRSLGADVLEEDDLSRLDGPRIALGEPAFDARFRIGSRAPSSSVKNFLDDRVLAALLGCRSKVELEYARGGAKLYVWGSTYEAADLDRAVELVVAACRSRDRDVPVGSEPAPRQ